MRSFTELYEALARSKSDNEKVKLIIDHFARANENDKIWALYILTGGKIKNRFKPVQLKEWAIESAMIPGWLFDDSYRLTGDLIETVSLILPQRAGNSDRTFSEWMDLIENVNCADEGAKKIIIELWKGLDQPSLVVFNKIISGTFRAVVSEKIIVKALSDLLSIESYVITVRIRCINHPDKNSFRELFFDKNETDEIIKPYPFVTGQILQDGAEAIKPGTEVDWHAQWKFKGIECQVIIRKGNIFIWTIDEELVTEKFPELEQLKYVIPDGTVFSGVIMCFDNGRAIPYLHLQSRLRRKEISKKLLMESPAVIVVNDVLEAGGIDLRNRPLINRKEALSDLKINIPGNSLIQFSENIKFNNMNELKELTEKATDNNADHLLIKRNDSLYLTENSSEIYIIKPEPFKINAVLMYALKDDMSDQFIEYTFGVWEDGDLVSVAKASSGLSGPEIKELSELINNNTLEKFGPVRTVKPEHVFEISFESISKSGRHKSGVKLHSPSIKNWNKNMKINDASMLDGLRKLVNIIK